MNHAEELREDIKGYQWLSNECIRLTKIASNAEPETDDQVLNIQKLKATESRSAQGRRLHRQRLRYQKKLERVHKLLESIVNDRDYAIVNCLIDGMSVTDVSKHIAISRKTVYRTLETLTEQFVEGS